MPIAEPPIPIVTPAFRLLPLVLLLLLVGCARETPARMAGDFHRHGLRGGTVLIVAQTTAGQGIAAGYVESAAAPVFAQLAGRQGRVSLAFHLLHSDTPDAIEPVLAFARFHLWQTPLEGDAAERTELWESLDPRPDYLAILHLRALEQRQDYDESGGRDCRITGWTVTTRADLRMIIVRLADEQVVWADAANGLRQRSSGERSSGALFYAIFKLEADPPPQPSYRAAIKQSAHNMAARLPRRRL